MEKHSNQMDLDEWEVLSDDGFFELHHPANDSHNKKVLTIDSGFDDYFICPSPKKSSVKNDTNNQIVPVTIQLDQEDKKTEEEQIIVKEMIKVAIFEIKTPKLALIGEDQDTISQGFFKKMKENMKLDSPESGSRGIKAPPIESGSIQFEDKEEAVENKKHDDQEVVVENYLDSDMKKDERNLEESNGGGGLHIWNWRLTGIGALCSMGITAATICIFIVGNRKKHHQQNQKFRIQIYAEDKMINQVVHHATKLNHAISAARGVPLTKAHITFGGYFDGL